MHLKIYTSSNRKSWVVVSLLVAQQLHLVGWMSDSYLGPLKLKKSYLTFQPEYWDLYNVTWDPKILISTPRPQIEKKHKKIQ